MQSGIRDNPRYLDELTRNTLALVLAEVEVGRHCRITRAVIDRGRRIPPGTVIGEDREADAKRFRVSGRGIVLVTPGMLGQEPTVSQT